MNACETFLWLCHQIATKLSQHLGHLLYSVLSRLVHVYEQTTVEMCMVEFLKMTIHHLGSTYNLTSNVVLVTNVFV